MSRVGDANTERLVVAQRTRRDDREAQSVVGVRHRHGADAHFDEGLYLMDLHPHRMEIEGLQAVTEADDAHLGCSVDVPLLKIERQIQHG